MGEARRAAHVRRSAVVLAAAMVLGSLASCGRSHPMTSPSTSATTSSTTTVAPTTGPSIATTTTTTVPPPTTVPTTPGIVVRHGDETHRWIALTFDAGSDAGNTAAILDLLAARHIRATFSLTGAWTRANPELARRIASEGHTIVNHTNTHQSFTGFSTGTRPLWSEERVAQLTAAEASITTTAGVSPRPWFRPPYGDYDSSTPTDAAALPSIIDGLTARGYGMVPVAVPGFVAD